MSKTYTMAAPPSGTHCLVLACIVVAAFALGERPAHAQARDSLLNGTLIGAAVGAGVGVAFTHAVRDAEGSGQYVYGGLVFGAIGAGVGLGIDALLNRAFPDPGITPRRVLIAPAVGRNGAGIVVNWTW